MRPLHGLALSFVLLILGFSKQRPKTPCPITGTFIPVMWISMALI
ncbi:hypothetical protein [Sulfitobacter sediminilitoris]